MKKYFLLFIAGLVLFGFGCLGNQNIPDIKPVPRLNSKVYLGDQELAEVPKYVFRMTEATELNLSGNKLSGALPAEIRQLKNLRILNLSNNQFTGLPAEIGQLDKLEILNISYNQITGLPLEISNLKNLKKFIFTDNNVSQIDLDQIKAALPNTQFIQ